MRGRPTQAEQGLKEKAEFLASSQRGGSVTRRGRRASALVGRLRLSQYQVFQLDDLPQAPASDKNEVNSKGGERQ